jgi:hypothetical protein
LARSIDVRREIASMRSDMEWASKTAKSGSMRGFRAKGMEGGVRIGIP